MKYRIFYGPDPEITNADRHDFDRGCYVCEMVMKDRKDRSVIISRCKDPSVPVWKVETGYSCFAFRTREETIAFCEKRYRRADGGAE